VIRQVGRGVEAALRDQFLHQALGLRGDLVSDRPRCPWGQRAPENIPQRVAQLLVAQPRIEQRRVGVGIMI